MVAHREEIQWRKKPLRQAPNTAETPGIYDFDDFVIVHGQSLKIVLALLLRGLLWKIGHLIRAA